LIVKRLALWSLSGMALFSSAAMALELPLAGSYGTEAGCSKAAEERTIPSGMVMAVARNEVFQGGLLCQYTGVTEKGGGPAAPTWEVSVSCSEGHEDDATVVTYAITERPAEKLLSVAIVNGPGIEGEFSYCPVQPPR
jgi:hypothetical protein